MLFAEIVLSAVNPLFFRQAVKKSAVRAFVYYLVFTTLYTLVVCGFGLWWASRNWTPTLEVAKRSMPPFEVKVTQGHLSTTLPEPFVFSDADFTLIVDTSGKTLDASPYKQAILISKTKAVLKKNRFESREYNFSEIPDFQLTTDDILAWLVRYKKTILWTFFSTLAFLVLPLAWMALLPVLFLFTLLLVIPAKIMGSHLRYGQVLSITFYAVTLPTFVQTYLFTRGTATGGLFWGMYFLWALVGVVVCRLGQGAAPPPMSHASSTTSSVSPGFSSFSSLSFSFFAFLSFLSFFTSWPVLSSSEIP